MSLKPSVKREPLTIERIHRMSNPIEQLLFVLMPCSQVADMSEIRPPCFESMCTTG